MNKPQIDRAIILLCILVVSLYTTYGISLYLEKSHNDIDVLFDDCRESGDRLICREFIYFDDGSIGEFEFEMEYPAEGDEE